jgi:hypothetical protein
MCRNTELVQKYQYKIENDKVLFTLPYGAISAKVVRKLSDEEKYNEFLDKTIKRNSQFLLDYFMENVFIRVGASVHEKIAWFDTEKIAWFDTKKIAIDKPRYCIFFE